jgi:hypothetical protein
MSSTHDDSGILDFDTLKDHFIEKKINVFENDEQLKEGGMYLIFLGKPLTATGREYNIVVYKGKEQNNSKLGSKKTPSNSLKFNLLFRFNEFEPDGVTPNKNGFVPVNSTGIVNLYSKENFKDTMDEDGNVEPTMVSVYDLSKGAERIDREYRDTANDFMKRVVERGYDTRTPSPEYDEFDADEWGDMLNEDEDSEKEKKNDEFRKMFASDDEARGGKRHRTKRRKPRSKKTKRRKGRSRKNKSKNRRR